MGLHIGFSSCRSDECTYREPCPKPKFPNLNPKNFHIQHIESIGDFHIVIVNYPDCTNYEGRKIMVYKCLHEDQILTASELDPHFCDGGHLSPIARFAPTPEALAMARVMCKKWNEMK